MMLFNVIKRNGDIVRQPINIGQKVVGIRISSFVVESSEEVAQLLTPEGQGWMLRHLMHQFKPIDDSTKEFHPANGLKLSPARLKKELEKCILLCSNCHRIRHHDSSRGW